MTREKLLGLYCVQWKETSETKHADLGLGALMILVGLGAKGLFPLTWTLAKGVIRADR